MNFIIIIVSCVAAYVLAEICSYIDRCIYKHQLKKFFKSDLNRFQAIKVMQEAKRIALEAGYDEESAFNHATQYCAEITQNGLLNEKYKLLKGA
jgi:hypothetical protein